jgi:hypothetical protein
VILKIQCQRAAADLQSPQHASYCPGGEGEALYKDLGTRVGVVNIRECLIEDARMRGCKDARTSEFEDI